MCAKYTKSDLTRKFSGPTRIIPDNVREKLKIFTNNEDLPQKKAKKEMTELLKYKDDLERRRIYDRLKLNLYEREKMEGRISGGQGPTSDQKALLFKKIRKAGFDPENIKDRILKLVPKDQPLTRTRMSEIVDKIRARQNVIRFSAVTDRQREEEKHKIGEEKINRLLTSDSGDKITGKQRLGTKEAREEDAKVSAMVSISEYRRNRSGLTGGKSAGGSSLTSGHSGAVGVGGVHGTGNVSSQNVLPGNLGIKREGRPGIIPGSIQKAA